MGMSQKQPKQKVGNAFFSSFGIAVASKVDRFISLWIDEEKISDIPDDAASRSTRIMTGKKSDQYPSDTGKSLVEFYNGINNSINPTMSSISGIVTKYNNLAYAFFNKAFLGDNVQNYPSYAFEVQRTHIMNWYSDGIFLDEVITEDGTRQANPAVILYYILNQMAEINGFLIDINSFVNSAKVLKEEKFGIALIINKENDLKNIIEEIIRHIDATFYFNIETGKYTIKLYRDDYNVDDLIEINEDNIKELYYKKGSFQDLSTHIVLNYISPINYKKATIYAENASLKTILNQNKTTEINYLCIQDEYLASSILNREYKKYCTPIATIKFKIPNSFKLSVFDVFKFSSKKLGINNMILRVLELSADEYEKNYYEVTCSEDIYSSNDYEITKFQTSNVEKINYSISNSTNIISNVIVLNRDITNNDSYPILLINDNVDNHNEYVNLDFISYNDKVFSQTTENYTTLKQDINFSKYNFYLDEILLNRQTWMENIELTDQDWQANGRMIVINNEIMSYKKLTIIDSNTVKLSNIIRNINNSIIQKHFNNDIVFFIENFEVFELTNFNTNEEYVELKIKCGNIYNSTSEEKFYLDNFEEFYNPYQVENVKYDINTKTLSFNTTQVNKNYTANYLTLEQLEVNVNSNTENSVDYNQSFEIHVKYQDGTNEVINTTNTTYTFTKNISINNCLIYNIINNKYSNYVKF